MLTTTEIKVPQLRPWQTTRFTQVNCTSAISHAALLLITESIRSGRTAECSTKPEHQASIDIIGCRCTLPSPRTARTARDAPVVPWD